MCKTDGRKAAIFHSPCSYLLVTLSETWGQLHSLKTLLNEAWGSKAVLGGERASHSCLTQVCKSWSQDPPTQWSRGPGVQKRPGGTEKVAPTMAKTSGPEIGNKAVGPTGSCGACHSLLPDLHCLLSVTEPLFSAVASKPRHSQHPQTLGCDLPFLPRH